jgi:signal transduction histidine kinase
LRSLLLGGESDTNSVHRRDAKGAEPAQRIEIQADARMLRQAFLNLIRNAAEAIPSDPPNDPPNDPLNDRNDQTDRRVTVRSSIERGPDGQQWAAISIQDTGQGIRPADLQKIFIPFFTTKSEGHGVGLALAHRVISEHGGTLTVENTSGGGALFTIRLPR